VTIIFPVVRGLFLFMKSIFVSLPGSKRLSLFWNFGSILAMVLAFQIVTGLFLVINFKSDRSLAFQSVQFIIYEVEFGYLFRIFHFNGANLFFIFLYLHLLKGLFYCRYRLRMVWVRGVTIFILVILTAFLGYVLVWGQIRFWAAVVITNLVRVIPYVGVTLIFWIWAGFSVNNGTLGLFFILHFLVPFIILIIVVLHLVFLHQRGRTSSLLCIGDYDKVKFFPFYMAKDGINILLWVGFFFLALSYPFVLGDAEIFIAANRLSSPVHIVPEWYFLFAYAILRAIPNKIIGVVAFAARLLRLYFLALSKNYTTILNLLNKFFVFWFVSVWLLLTWVGQCRVEAPFIVLGFVFFVCYFRLLFIIYSTYTFSYKFFL